MKESKSRTAAEQAFLPQASGRGLSPMQDAFLHHVRDSRISVTLFLVNGVKLQGIIAAVDPACILLRREGHVQLVYKHAVSTIMPGVALTDFTLALEDSSS